ncbi:MAG: tRNA (adenosine(37)-N6)-threonylcarbamoyltransferase complex dimerization subunit type 1 TsaB [Chloroflexi bacterium]|nr:tRNA (adenosine(37)-N6)-threonylcarbamoyltransferase complex dimerization subunit type 1 TsaB [Chloroflexota bacterium]
MMLLALDTSTQKIGMALYDGIQLAHEAVWTSRNNHTIELTPTINNALERTGLKIEDLKAVCVAIGPGSYTGLRIGLAVAKGLALARNLPLVGVPTLDILAAAQPPKDLPMAAVLQAGRGRLAVGWYQVKDGAWQQKKEAQVLVPADLSKRIRKPTLICGEITADVRRLLGRKRKNALLVSPAQGFRRPGFLAELGWQRWQDGDVDDPATLVPLYLQAKEPLPA